MHRPGTGFWTDRDAAVRAEWLETNGLGGFASSSIAGRNTRRYHGLLVSATKPPVGRVVLLAKLEETLVLGGDRFDLGTNRYPGAIHPEGDLLLSGFTNEPFPAFTYEVGGARLVRTLFLVHGEDTLVVRWELDDPKKRAARLEVRPLLAYRDYHALQRENGEWNRDLDAAPGAVTVRPYEGLPRLTFAHDASALDGASFWYRSFEYEREEERGFDFREDLFSPFRLDLPLARPAALVVSTSGRAASEAGELEERERERRAGVEGREDDPLALRTLRRAADQYLVARGESKEPSTVIAGYPWFTDWGRDTMIALPGLALAARRPDVARRILATFAATLDAGMVPNRFPDGGETPEYNTVDGTLWFVEAVRAYATTTRDAGFLRELFPALLGIVEAHVKGTRYGIRVDTDGLLEWRAEGEALTWMDARVGGRPVTPRQGKAVEIQALWHNALSFLATAAHDLGDEHAAEELTARALAVRDSFEKLFWNEDAGCLFDVVDGTQRDASIRPNQVFAVSLRHPLLVGQRAASVVAAVEKHLLTPYGLRTLAPSDPKYVGRYEGGPAERDGAYHQGTVWPWLLGPFAKASVKVHPDAEGRRRAAHLVRPLVSWALGPGLGHVPELFDGDAPHRPAGCFAQAWSVAQLFEAVTAIGTID